MGLEAVSSTSAELAARLKADYDRWDPIVESIGFTAEGWGVDPKDIRCVPMTHGHFDHVGSGIMAGRLSGGNAGIALLANTLATVFMLFVLIETLWPISG